MDGDTLRGNATDDSNFAYCLGIWAVQLFDSHPSIASDPIDHSRNSSDEDKVGRFGDPDGGDVRLTSAHWTNARLSDHSLNVRSSSAPGNVHWSNAPEPVRFVARSFERSSSESVGGNSRTGSRFAMPVLAVPQWVSQPSRFSDAIATYPAHGLAL